MKHFTLPALLLVLLAGTGLAHAQGRGRDGAGGLPPGQRGPGGNGGFGRNQPPSAGATPGGNGTRQAPHNALQIGPSGRWWDDKSVVRSVGITPVQQHKMDTVFDANKPAILSSYKTLLAQQARLATLNKAAQPDQAAVFAQIDSVNQARAALQKATAQMLLQIRQEMVPEQVQKLEQIQ